MFGAGPGILHFSPAPGDTGLADRYSFEVLLPPHVVVSVPVLCSPAQESVLKAPSECAP